MEVANQNSRRRRKPLIDRLSELPNSILCHILSFLPTKISVRTSILARRWRYLWSYVPNFDFDVWQGNHKIVKEVMLIHKLPTINTFRLYVGDRGDEYELETWISIAIDRNVQNIDISLHGDMMLPNCLLTCKNLVDLSMTDCSLPDVGSVVYLPHLKKLQLIHVLHEVDESFLHFLSGCPVLEELEIRLIIDYQSCKISSPTVKRLMIDLRCECDDYEDGDYYSLEINTPALVYLQLVDGSAHHIKTELLTSLIEADIHIYNYIESDDFPYFPYLRSVAEFIDGLHNVKCLKLNLSDIACAKSIDSVFSASMTTRFRNLIKLEFTGHCRFLSKFLENADNLEILILREVGEGKKEWIDPQQVPTCLLSHLRTIRLCGHVVIDYDFEDLRYLLRNGEVLERMEISYTYKHMLYIFERISQFERRSRACEVALIS